MEDILRNEIKSCGPLVCIQTHHNVADLPLEYKSTDQKQDFFGSYSENVFRIFPLLQDKTKQNRIRSYFSIFAMGVLINIGKDYCSIVILHYLPNPPKVGISP